MFVSLVPFSLFAKKCFTTWIYLKTNKANKYLTPWNKSQNHYLLKIYQLPHVRKAHLKLIHQTTHYYLSPLHPLTHINHIFFTYSPSKRSLNRSIILNTFLMNKKISFRPFPEFRQTEDTFNYLPGSVELIGQTKLEFDLFIYLHCIYRSGVVVIRMVFVTSDWRRMMLGEVWEVVLYYHKEI